MKPDSIHLYAKHAAPWPDPRRHRPSKRHLAHWAEVGQAEATDGCRVSGDYCEHDYPSWLLYLSNPNEEQAKGN